MFRYSLSQCCTAGGASPCSQRTSELGHHPGSECLHAACIATPAEDMVVQWVAAPALCFRREQQSTVLASVTVDMEAPVQGNNSHCLFFPWLWHNWLRANATARGKFLVEVVDAVNPTRGVHSEGNAVQALATHDAPEAGWVVGLACGTQDPVQDRLFTHAAFLQSVQVVIFTVWLPFHGKKGLSSQLFHAHMAGEALDVVDLVHGSAPTAFPQNFFTTLVTHPKEIWVAGALHALNKQVSKVVHLSLLAPTVTTFVPRAHAAWVVG